MARPFKSGVDYFPLDVVMDDEIELIESEHGIEGFGVLIKLYQKIYACNYWIKWDKKATIVFSKRVNVNINKVNAIINSCLEWEIFREGLYEKYEILTSVGIQKRFFEIIKRRKNIDVINDYLLIDPLVYVDSNSINVSKSTQSKVEETKPDEIKQPNTPKKKISTKIEKPENVTEQTWNDFLTHRKNKKANVTQTVINGFKKQADLAGFTLENAFKESIERGWTGFKAEWVNKGVNQQNKPNPDQERTFTVEG